jgi:hypothetical protein
VPSTPQKPRPPLSGPIACAVFLGVSLVTIASCGSRTGLFGSDGTSVPDSAIATDAPPASDADSGPIACTPGRFPFERGLAQLMLVIDRSGSMAHSLDGIQPNASGELPPGVASRWQVLRNGLFKAILPFDTTIAMGAKFYPEEEPHTLEPDGCLTDLGVGLAPAPGNASQILDVFDTTKPKGGTPTSEAIRIAAQSLSASRAVARTMIVATDGAPNCNADVDLDGCVCTVVLPNGTEQCKDDIDGSRCLDDRRTIGVVKEIFEKQRIPVYVIGIGGTERPAFLSVLDAMAVAGGRAKPTAPRHYSVQTETEMNDALASISGSVAKCTFLTPSAPTDPSAITVEIDGRRIGRDPTHTNGWDWVDQAYGTLAFFGSACDDASKDGAKAFGVVRCD